MWMIASNANTIMIAITQDPPSFTMPSNPPATIAIPNKVIVAATSNNPKKYKQLAPNVFLVIDMFTSIFVHAKNMHLQSLEQVRFLQHPLKIICR